MAFDAFYQLPGRRIAPFHNLFFAICPDEGAASSATHFTDEYRRANGLRGRPMDAPRLHITLNNLGAHRLLPRDLIAAAIEAASRVSLPKFLVEFDRVVSWRGRPRPLVLTGGEGVIGSHILHRALHDALSKMGLVTGAEPKLNPHMTLLRDRKETPEEFIQPIRWTVREFRLIDSPYGESRHNILGRWPLEP